MVKLNQKTGKAHFEFTMPDATSVKVLGDFNMWDGSANEMVKDKKGNWSADIELPEGVHEFRYLVDENTWSNDTEAPSVLNVFGSWNSIVEVFSAVEEK